MEALERKASQKQLILHDKKQLIEHIFPTLDQLQLTLKTYDILRHHWPLAPIISSHYQNYSLMMKDCGLPLRHRNIAERIKALTLLPLTAPVTLPQCFTPQLIKEELDLFYDWFIKQLLSLSSRQYYQHFLERFVNLVDQTRIVPIHRDYHCENVLSQHGRLYLVDYQDALMGPYLYDAVSFIEDAYQEDKSFQSIAFNLFLKRFQGYSFDLKQDYKLCAQQRLMKMIGIFSRLSLRDHKQRYEQYLPKLLTRLIEISESSLEQSFFQRLFICLKARR